MRIFFILIIICTTLIFCFETKADNYQPAGRETIAFAKRALDTAKKADYQKALIIARESKDAALLKLILWMQYNDGSSDYETIKAFAKQNPTWPDIKRLENKAEESVKWMKPGKQVIEIFKYQEPSSPAAIMLLAQSYLAMGIKQDDAKRLIRKSWVLGNFEKKQEEQFLKQYSTILTNRDHFNRVNRLLWEDKITPARRILSKLDSDSRKLFIARMSLMLEKNNAEKTVSSVPLSLRQDPGLIYQIIKWNQEREKFDQSYEVLRLVKSTMQYQEKWWEIKNSFIRQMLKLKRFKEAYNIASNHGNKDNNEDIAQAEWLAGWLALRFLNKPDIAYKHFNKFLEVVSSPISKSRGSYWAARAADDANQINLAKRLYREASNYPTTFYGQIALSKLDNVDYQKLFTTPTPSKKDITKFKNNELVKIAYILAANQEYKLAEKFTIAAINSAISPGEMALISDLGNAIGRNDLAIIAANNALKRGTLLLKTSYPVIKDIPDVGIDKSMILAIIRQESRFNVTAKSSADASGLMQLLPSTAKDMARKLDMKYHFSHLTNPSKNIKLGSNYFKQLLNNHEGSYILAIASYNAGSGNARKWVETYGDPRQYSSVEDIIDWIELIPFYETRNYLHRVLENTLVYKYVLDGRLVDLRKYLLARSGGNYSG